MPETPERPPKRFVGNGPGDDPVPVPEPGPPLPEPEPQPPHAPPAVTRRFWAAAFERALRTYAQAVLAMMGTEAVEITHLDWKVILLVGATAAVASLLFSIVNAATTPDRNPALYEHPREKVRDSASPPRRLFGL